MNKAQIAQELLRRMRPELERTYSGGLGFRDPQAVTHQDGLNLRRIAGQELIPEVVLPGLTTGKSAIADPRIYHTYRGVRDPEFVTGDPALAAGGAHTSPHVPVALSYGEMTDGLLDGANRYNVVLRHPADEATQYYAGHAARVGEEPRTWARIQDERSERFGDWPAGLSQEDRDGIMASLSYETLAPRDADAAYLVVRPGFKGGDTRVFDIDEFLLNNSKPYRPRPQSPEDL